MNKLIKLTNDHYVVVDETIQPVNGYYYDSFINKIKSTNGAEYGEASHCWQITHSTQPLETYFYEVGGGTKVFGKIQQLSLQEVKELIGEVDVEKKAKKDAIEIFGNDFSLASLSHQTQFKRGYNQALEDNKEKKYTEEDLLNALYSMWYKAKDGDFNIKEAVKASIDYIKPKTSWEVEWETIDNRQPCDCSCHNNPNMIHFVACCNDGWIGKITQKLKLK